MDVQAGLKNVPESRNPDEPPERGGADLGGPDLGGPGLNADDLEMVYEFVDDNLSSPIDIADVAEYCGFPHASLEQQFELAVGHSLTLYIMEQRVKQAQRLMEGPAGQKRTMEHVADACGFTDVRDFEGQFRRLVGMSPDQFKNRFGV